MTRLANYDISSIFKLFKGIIIYLCNTILLLILDLSPPSKKIDVWWELLVPLIYILNICNCWTVFYLFLGRYHWCVIIYIIINLWIKKFILAHIYGCIECESRFSCGWMYKVLLFLINKGCLLRSICVFVSVLYDPISEWHQF